MRLLQDRFSGAERTLALFRAAVDALPHSLTVLDGDGTIVLVNDAWRRFGDDNGLLDRHSGVGTSYIEACRQAEQGDASDAATARQVVRGIEDLLEGRTDHFEVEYPCHSPREERWFQVRGTVVVADERPWVVLVHENVTARRTAMAGLAAKVSAQRTWDRENDIRLLAGLASGRTRLTLLHTDLAPHLDALHSAFTAQLPEGNRRLTKRILAPLPVLVDPRAFGQALLELLLNAYAATEPGGSIHLEAQAEDGEVHVIVIDDGHGFDAQELAARMEAVDIDDEPEGVGLALAQMVVKHHNGALRLQSDGQGAVATLVLPLQGRPDAP